MADLFRALADNNGADNTPVGNRPTGTADGDYLLALVQSASATETITVVPSGWTLVQEDTTVADFTTWLYEKTAASEPATWSWTKSAAAAWRVSVTAFQNVHATTPRNAQAVENIAGANTIAVGPITPSVDGCTIWTAGSVDATGAARTWTADGTPTERLDALAQSLHTAIYTEEQVTAAAITRSLTVTGSVQDISGHIVAIAPAAGGGGGPTLF